MVIFGCHINDSVFELFKKLFSAIILDVRKFL